jgi:hypothetical protein
MKHCIFVVFFSTFTKLKYNGENKGVELGAVIWVRFYDLDTAKN